MPKPMSPCYNPCVQMNAQVRPDNRVKGLTNVNEKQQQEQDVTSRVEKEQKAYEKATKAAVKVLEDYLDAEDRGEEVEQYLEPIIEKLKAYSPDQSEVVRMKGRTNVSGKDKREMIERIIGCLGNGLDEAYEWETEELDTKVAKDEFDSEWVILAIEALVGQINEMLTASDFDNPEMRATAARELSKIQVPK